MMRDKFSKAVNSAKRAVNNAGAAMRTDSVDKHYAAMQAHLEAAEAHRNAMLVNAQYDDAAGGHWVTLEEGQHVFIDGEGQMQFHGPQSKGASRDNGSDRTASKQVQPGHAATGGRVADEAGRSGDRSTGGRGQDAGQPVGAKTVEHVPADKHEVIAKLEQMEQHFRSVGDHDQANLLAMFKDHVNQVGTEEALKSLGEAHHGAGEQVQYAGWNDMSHFAKSYLAEHGIVMVPGEARSADYEAGKRIVSTVTPTSDKAGFESRGAAGDVFPKLQTLRDKLDETQHLPGLESTEDLSKLMGGKFGDKVTHLTKDVTDKLDQKYGKGQWVVKSYGDEAYAGYGIFFPQRADKLNQEAKDVIWQSGAKLAEHGFSHLRDESGKIIGVQHDGGEKYLHGTAKHDEQLYGEVRHASDMVSKDRWTKDAKGNDINVGKSIDNEHATALPEGKFMASPAFPVVGISNEERAAGITFKRGGEGRVHIVTKDGVASVIPHSTWLKEEPLPIVFENDDTRAMAKVAVDAINALPHSERQGQLYAPDIVRTKDGYKVVEANPANEAGASGYLQDNPFIIDSYVSHVTGREPAHVKFIRDLLSKKNRTPTENQLLADLIRLERLLGNANPNHDRLGRFADSDNRPSTPEERHEGSAPKVKAWKAPPSKKQRDSNAPLRPTGDASQTKQGDLAEAAANKLGFRNILPEGKRNFTAKEVAEKGSSIDLEYDHSGKLMELKMCKTTSTEFRLKAKKEEKDDKMRYAANVKAEAYTLIGVHDVDTGKVHFYVSKEPGLTGAEVSRDKFDYLGSANMGG